MPKEVLVYQLFTQLHCEAGEKHFVLACFFFQAKMTRKKESYKLIVDIFLLNILNVTLWRNQSMTLHIF